MKYNIFFLVLVLLFMSLTDTSAQVDSVYYGKPAEKPSTTIREKPKPQFNWKEKLSFGGNFMLWFGSSAYVYLSPTVNLRLHERINVGLGVIYNYNSYYQGPVKYEWSVYGAHSYLMAFVTKNLFGKIEYNRLYQPDYYGLSLNDKIWVNYVFVGGGFSQRLGDRSGIYTSVMWNITDSPQTFLYPNPIIQVGILAGF